MAAKPEIYKGRVKALARGYANGTIYDPEEVFEFEGPLGSWMENLDEPVKAPSQAPKAMT
jgi:hypothetical protein